MYIFMYSCIFGVKFKAFEYTSNFTKLKPIKFINLSSYYVNLISIFMYSCMF